MRGEGLSFNPEQPKPIPNVDRIVDEETIQSQEAERDFFSGLAIDESEFKQTHQLGPEVETLDVIQERRKTARGIMQRMREHPLSKSLLRMMSILVGVTGIAYGTMRERSAPSSEDEPQIEEAINDSGVRYELKKILYEELLDQGQVLGETEARFGKSEWGQEERLEYEQIPDLSGRFEYLHKDNPDLVVTYRSPEGRLESFGGILELMNIEFSRSSLPNEFVEQCVYDAGEVFPKLEQNKALELYRVFSHDVAKLVGIRSVRDLSSRLVEVLPDDHSVVKQIETDGWLKDEVAQWLKPSKDNTVNFDQANGRFSVYHHIDGKMALLDVFPANGGRPDGIAWEPGLPGHVVVRTPDGDFTFDRVIEKKSPSWKNSWVADTAQLRWSEDKNDVDYLDQDGKWRRLTGEDAEFVVYGAPQKPFKEKMSSSLYKQVSQKQIDGSWLRPKPFRVVDALGKDGELRPIWDRNDFGPHSLRMKNDKGEFMSVYFHSSPSDESPNDFLGYSHGCIHMKPDDIVEAASYLSKDSGIRISSLEDTIIISEYQKRGSGSALTEG